MPTVPLPGRCLLAASARSPPRKVAGRGREPASGPPAWPYGRATAHPSVRPPARPYGPANPHDPGYRCGRAPLSAAEPYGPVRPPVVSSDPVRPPVVWSVRRPGASSGLVWPCGPARLRRSVPPAGSGRPRGAATPAPIPDGRRPAAARWHPCAPGRAVRLPTPYASAPVRLRAGWPGPLARSCGLARPYDPGTPSGPVPATPSPPPAGHGPATPFPVPRGLAVTRRPPYEPGPAAPGRRPHPSDLPVPLSPCGRVFAWTGGLSWVRVPAISYGLVRPRGRPGGRGPAVACRHRSGECRRPDAGRRSGGGVPRRGGSRFRLASPGGRRRRSGRRTGRAASGSAAGCPA